MSRETEKILKQMEEYFNQFDLKNEEEAEEKLQEFMKKLNNNEIEFKETPEMKSNELLDEAYEEISDSKAKKLAKQALEIWPDNIDAECFLADFEKNQIKRLKLYEDIVEKATKLLEKDNMFDEENIGHFWGILETRPYMRARNTKVSILDDLGRYSEAIGECEDLLKLCESDNLGIRYRLIGLYCMLEKFDKCEYLYKKYNEYSANMIFVMALMYFKKGDYKNSKKYLRKLNDCNEYVFGILNNDYELRGNVKYYGEGTIEEASIIVEDNLGLIGSTPSFITYMQIVLEN